jgi:hypothetical protein
MAGSRDSSHHDEHCNRRRCDRSDDLRFYGNLASESYSMNLFRNSDARSAERSPAHESLVCNPVHSVCSSGIQRQPLASNSSCCSRERLCSCNWCVNSSTVVVSCAARACCSADCFCNESNCCRELSTSTCAVSSYRSTSASRFRRSSLPVLLVRKSDSSCSCAAFGCPISTDCFSRCFRSSRIWRSR